MNWREFSGKAWRERLYKKNKAWKNQHRKDNCWNENRIANVWIKESAKDSCFSCFFYPKMADSISKDGKRSFIRVRNHTEGWNNEFRWMLRAVRDAWGAVTSFKTQTNKPALKLSCTVRSIFVPIILFNVYVLSPITWNYRIKTLHIANMAVFKWESKCQQRWQKLLIVFGLILKVIGYIKRQ